MPIGRPLRNLMCLCLCLETSVLIYSMFLHEWEDRQTVETYLYTWFAWPICTYTLGNLLE